MSDPQGEGRLSGEVTSELLRAVCPGARIHEGVAWPLGPTLHGEGGLAAVVNVRVGGVVPGRSGTLGEILRGTSDVSPG